jgi:hypothetical protein
VCVNASSVSSIVNINTSTTIQFTGNCVNHNSQVLSSNHNSQGEEQKLAIKDKQLDKLI